VPITCPILFPALTSEEFGELDYVVMGHAFASHRDLGRLADETIYRSDLAARLLAAGIPAQREVPVTVSFRDFSKTCLLDLVVSNRSIYELKAAAALAGEHDAQLLNYLFLTDSRRGKLMNFRPQSVESKFVNAVSTRAERREFTVDASQWRDSSALPEFVVELVRDWGTGLELSLYRQAVVRFLGGEAQVSRLRPLSRKGVALGNQSFDHVTSDSALRLTALEAPPPPVAHHLRRLLDLTPLRALHWINLASHKITFTTLHR